MSGILNSTFAEWYFRLGSTNAHVSHYQLYNLPCPIFASTSSFDKRGRDPILADVSRGDLGLALESLPPLTVIAPFDSTIADAIIAAVDRIVDLEQRRGDIARTDRSALDPLAQNYQDLVNTLLFWMAGLSADEVTGLEDRLKRIL